MRRPDLVAYAAAFVTGEVLGTVARNPLPPPPTPAFDLSLLFSLAGICAVVYWFSKRRVYATLALAGLCAGTYLGYVW